MPLRTADLWRKEFSLYRILCSYFVKQPLLCLLKINANANAATKLNKNQRGFDYHGAVAGFF
jgi:hypothetical protein